MSLKIEVETKTFLRLAIVIFAFVFTAYLIMKAQYPLTIIGISVFLALALNPSVNFIAGKLPGRSRIAGTAISYVTVLSVIGFLLFLITPPFFEQSAKFATTLPSLIDTVTSQRFYVDDFVARFGLENQLDQSIEDAKSQAASIANDLGRMFVEGIATLFNGVLTLILVLVFTFLLLIEGPSWLEKIWGLYHDPKLLNRHRNVVSKMYRVVVGYVNGQMLVALIAATLTLCLVLVLSLIFDLPANLAFPLASIIFITGLIPMVGATIGATLVTLLLLLNDVTAAIIFLVFFIVYQQVENNFISPVVQSKQVELSALAVLIAIAIGVSLFGFIGGIISIPIAGCIRVLLVDYLEHAEVARTQKRGGSSLSKLVEKIR